MEHIALLLPKNSGPENVVRQVRAAVVVRAADEAIKAMFPADGQRIKARSFRKGLLAFACASADSAKEIMRREKEIIRRVNARLSSPEVERVRATG